jgi:hypothetical protein
MAIVSPTTPVSIIPPSSTWIRFLRSYGPTPNNTTLFDEYTVDALKRAKVQPIELASPQLKKIFDRLDSGQLGSILIAGTAGDGKTYHCRSLWMHLGGSATDWADKKAPVKELTLRDGRTAVFVKDLTELSDQESDEALGLLESSVLGNEDRRFLVLVANHGQVLERLRDCGRRQGRQHPLRLPVQEAFLQRSESPPRLALFDLSRATADTAREVFLAVAAHPEWENCKTCPLHTQEQACPIFENRNRMLGTDDGGRLRERLGSLVEIARLNGWHLPVRDLLALASNMVLGHPTAKEGLMSCSDVPKLQEKDLTEFARIYDNVFGANLAPRRAMSKPIFRALAVFAVGSETTNGADGLMVFGADDPKLQDAFARLLGTDKMYGATPGYLSSLQRYLEGEEAARTDGGAAEFLSRLASQRRRLFFTLPDADPDYSYWPMTAFCFAGDYLGLMAALGAGRSVSEPVRARLVRGLNRVMTGLLIENTDKIFVASSGGFTQSRVSVLCDTEAPGRRTAGVGLRIRLDAISGRPVLDVALAQGDAFSAILALSPVRFEFLCRVADGALPGSFSNECLEDMLAFKAKLLRKAELLRAANGTEEDDGRSDALTLRFIEVEQSGHGYSKPVTVRTEG